MAVPKKRTASSKRRMRRSHHARRPLKLMTCPRCKHSIISHVACPYCGTYQGRQVIDVLSKLNKKERKKKEKALAQEKPQ
jgi:large subunit ribosomal protein L32